MAREQFKKAIITKAHIEAERLSREQLATAEYNKFTTTLCDKYDVVINAHVIVTSNGNYPQISITAK